MGVDEETFLEHLKTLHIDTGGVSFAWLLDESNEILNWFYKNIDTNNCLTPEDNAKFSQLENSGEFLNETELEIELAEITKKYPGIALPGHVNDVIDAKQKLENLQENIDLLQTQEKIKSKLLETASTVCRDLQRKQFDLNEKLSIENTILAKLTEECENLVTKTREVKLQCYNTVGEVLKICTESKNSEQKLFFSQMPLEDYWTKSEMLATYLKCNASQQLEYFSSTLDHQVLASDLLPLSQASDHLKDAKLAEIKLQESCSKLKDGLYFYIKTKSELEGYLEQVKFLENFDVDACYDTRFEKVKMAGLVKILEADMDTYQQEKLPNAIQKFVERQSEQVILNEMQLKYDKAKYLYEKFCSLATLSQEAVSESGVALMCLKRDQLAVDNLLQFSMDTINCLKAEIIAKKSRKMIPRTVSSMSFFLKTLYSFFQIDEHLPIEELCTTIERLNIEVEDLEKSVFYDKFSKILAAIDKSKKMTNPMRELIWDGPTNQPSRCNRALDMALYELKTKYIAGEESVKYMSKVYTEFKDFTEKGGVLYNLWKWFLCDPSKIRTMIEEYNSREHRPTKPF